MREGGILDQDLAGAVQELYRVCSPAIHGMEPSSEQKRFVSNVYPKVIAALKAIA